MGPCRRGCVAVGDAWPATTCTPRPVTRRPGAGRSKWYLLGLVFELQISMSIRLFGHRYLYSSSWVAQGAAIHVMPRCPLGTQSAPCLRGAHSESSWTGHCVSRPTRAPGHPCWTLFFRSFVFERAIGIGQPKPNRISFRPTSHICHTARENATQITARTAGHA